MKGNDFMFKKTRIHYDENTGVKTVEEYNPVKEKLQKFGAKTVEVGTDAFEFIGEYGWAINLALGGALLIWTIGLKNGIDVTNKSLLEGYKNDGILCTGSGIVFKKKMSFDDWMQYLDHGYSTKKGWKTKNVIKYLKEKGFID